MPSEPVRREHRDPRTVRVSAGGCGPVGWVAASDDQEDAESRLRQVAAAVAVKQFAPLRTADHVTLRQPLQADVTASLA
jgi:hypothetical protein